LTNCVDSIHIDLLSCHGDARYANLVRRSDGSLFWIDFAAAFPINLTQEQLQVGFMMDMRTHSRRILDRDRDENTSTT
jgi:hypothetical protein